MTKLTVIGIKSKFHLKLLLFHTIFAIQCLLFIIAFIWRLHIKRCDIFFLYKFYRKWILTYNEVQYYITKTNPLGSSLTAYKTNSKQPPSTLIIVIDGVACCDRNRIDWSDWISPLLMYYYDNFTTCFYSNSFAHY